MGVALGLTYFGGNFSVLGDLNWFSGRTQHLWDKPHQLRKIASKIPLLAVRDSMFSRGVSDQESKCIVRRSMESGRQNTEALIRRWAEVWHPTELIW